MMVYFTGDIHGFPWGVYNFCNDYKLTKDDIVVLLGDVGANYYNNERDDAMKAVLTRLFQTFLCIHGNHEMRPWNITGYHLTERSKNAVAPGRARPDLRLRRSQGSPRNGRL